MKVTSARPHPVELPNGRLLQPYDTAEVEAPEDEEQAKRQREALDALLDSGQVVDASDAPSDDDVLKGEALKARAEELAIEGRSQMSADELRAAITAAEKDGD